MLFLLLLRTVTATWRFGGIFGDFGPTGWPASAPRDSELGLQQKLECYYGSDTISALKEEPLCHVVLLVVLSFFINPMGSSGTSAGS